MSAEYRVTRTIGSYTFTLCRAAEADNLVVAQFFHIANVPPNFRPMTFDRYTEAATLANQFANAKATKMPPSVAALAERLS